MTERRLTAGRALALLLEWRTAAAYSPATVAYEQEIFEKLLPRLAKPLGRIRRVDVERLLAVQAGKLKPASLSSELTALRMLFRVLEEAGHVTANPTDGLSVKVPRTRTPALSEQAVRRLIEESSRVVTGARRRGAVCEALALRNRAVLELLYGVGLRSAELCAVRVLDLQLPNASLLVRRAKRGKPAHLPLPLAAVPHLRAYLTQGRAVLVERGDRSEGRLFTTMAGRPLSGGQLLRLLRHIAERAGVSGVYPHAMRRALATHLVKHGAPVTAVQYLLGHKSVDTTQRYLGLCLDDLHAAVAVLERGRSDRPGR